MEVLHAAQCELLCLESNVGLSIINPRPISEKRMSLSELIVLCQMHEDIDLILLH